MALKDFSKPLGKTIPMFCYRPVFKKLHFHKAYFEKDKNKLVGEISRTLLDKLPRFFLSNNLPQRLIHTDPKISNFIFNSENEALAIIDLDTVQKLSPPLRSG